MNTGSAKSGMLAVPVPIEGRKRTRFVIYAPDVPVDMPFLVDMEGRLHCRYGSDYGRPHFDECNN